MNLKGFEEEATPQVGEGGPGGVARSLYTIRHYSEWYIYTILNKITPHLQPARPHCVPDCGEARFIMQGLPSIPDTQRKS